MADGDQDAQPQRVANEVLERVDGVRRQRLGEHARGLVARELARLGPRVVTPGLTLDAQHVAVVAHVHAAGDEERARLVRHAERFV
jgi:hypothetical protein